MTVTVATFHQASKRVADDIALAYSVPPSDFSLLSLDPTCCMCLQRRSWTAGGTNGSHRTVMVKHGQTMFFSFRNQDASTPGKFEHLNGCPAMVCPSSAKLLFCTRSMFVLRQAHVTTEEDACWIISALFDHPEA